MADTPGPAGADDLVRRLVDANVTYVRAWGELVTDWLGAVGQVVREVPRTVSVQAPGATAGAAKHDATRAEHAAHAPAGRPATARGETSVAEGAAPAAGAAALVLEGSAGAEAGGAFEVENVLGAPASASVVLEPFRDAAGGTLDVEATVRPDVVTLEAGESTVVVLRVRVPETALPGTDYRSVLRIEGIPAGTVAVVLRRTDG